MYDKGDSDAPRFFQLPTHPEGIISAGGPQGMDITAQEGVYRPEPLDDAMPVRGTTESDGPVEDRNVSAEPTPSPSETPDARDSSDEHVEPADHRDIPPEPPGLGNSHEAYDDDRSPQAVLARCQTAIDAGYTRVDEWEEQGHHLPSDAPALGARTHDAIIDAATQGDPDGLRESIDELVAIRDLPSNKLVEGLLDAIWLGDTAGATAASAHLNGILGHEQALMRRFIDSNPDRPDLQLTHTGEHLDAVIAHCERVGLPPNGWIDQFATTPIAIWRDYFLHHYREVERGNPTTAAHVDALRQKTIELVEPGTFEPWFVIEQMPTALLTVADQPEIQERLVQGFLRAWDDPDTWPDEKNVRILAEVSQIILCDPQLATPDTVSDLENAIEGAGEVLSQADCSEAEIGEILLPWTVARQALADPRGATPHVLMEYATKATRALLDTIPLESRTGEEEGILVKIHDELLRVFSEHFAMRRNFTGAREFIAGIMQPDVKSTAVQNCLNLTRTVSETINLQPRFGISLIYDPNTSLQFQFTRARVVGNPALLTALAVRCAETLDDSDTENAKLWMIRAAYETVAKKDPRAAATIARARLAAARKRGEPYDTVAEYSLDLVKAGDSDEPADAYEHIRQTAGNDPHIFIGLVHYWNLARALAQNLTEPRT